MLKKRQVSRLWICSIASVLGYSRREVPAYFSLVKEAMFSRLERFAHKLMSLY